MKKTYFPFLIGITILFSIEIIIYFTIIGFFFAELVVVLFFLPKLALSVCNYIGGKNDRFNTKSNDRIILIMCFVSLIPLTKFITSAVGLFFCIKNISEYRKWKKYIRAEKEFEDFLKSD